MAAEVVVVCSLFHNWGFDEAVGRTSQVCVWVCCVMCVFLPFLSILNRLYFCCQPNWLLLLPSSENVELKPIVLALLPFFSPLSSLYTLYLYKIYEGLAFVIIIMWQWRRCAVAVVYTYVHIDIFLNIFNSSSSHSEPAVGRERAFGWCCCCCCSVVS